MSKGSAPRPAQISKEEIANNWENTFGKKTKVVPEKKEKHYDVNFPEKKITNGFYNLGELRSIMKSLENEPDTTNVITQVVGSEYGGGAWNMFAQLNKVPNSKNRLVLTLNHPDLENF